MTNHSCLRCVHEDVCIKRSMAVFTLFIQMGRYDEAKEAQKDLDIGVNCENWEGAEWHSKEGDEDDEKTDEEGGRVG